MRIFLFVLLGWQTAVGSIDVSKKIRKLEEEPLKRALRVKVFWDPSNILWDKKENSGDKEGLVPPELQQWIVSLDERDIGTTRWRNGLLVYEATDYPIWAGMLVCVRPPDATYPQEQACTEAGVQCAADPEDLDFTKFPYENELRTSTVGSGYYWRDGWESLAPTAMPWWKVYVKDFCYRLQAEDFLERNGNEEAWVRFSFALLTPPTTGGFEVEGTEDLPSLVPSRTPTALPSTYPSLTPSLVPTRVPTFSPSVRPSDLPSDVPSDTPSWLPSDAPSSIPSDTPSGTPSTQPSAAPTSVPYNVADVLDRLEETDRGKTQACHRPSVYSTCWVSPFASLCVAQMLSMNTSVRSKAKWRNCRWNLMLRKRFVCCPP